MLGVFFLVFSINPTQATKIEQELFEQDTQVCFSNTFTSTMCIAHILYI